MWQFDSKRFFTGSPKVASPDHLVKKIDLVEKPSSRGFELQKEVIPPGKRDETSTWDPSRHLTARIDRDPEIVAYMHDERWNPATHLCHRIFECAVLTGS
jgi:hypothetical protein